jgi:hypothetical protein
MLLACFAAATLLAHSWYPPDCCGDGDCHPVPCREISKAKNNYWVWQGYYFTQPQHHFSPDGACHVCLDRKYPLMGTLVPRCIFTPVHEAKP